MKRPFLSVASFYAVGILAGSLLAVPLLTLFAASFAVLAFALLFARFRPLLLALLLLFAGWTNLRLRTAVLAPDDLRHLLGPRPEIVTLRGALIQSPRVTILQRRDRDIERSLALVRVAKIQRKNHWQPASGKLIVATPAPLGTNYFSGEPIQVFGVIARPPAPLAPGLFDYRNYLAVRGIYFELKTGSVADWRLPAPHPARPPMNDRFMAWAHRALAAGLPPDQSQRLLRAMSLGWRTAFTGDVGDPFLRAGTMHLFAIDGLRIALLAAMFVAVLRAVRLSRAWCGALAAPLIWFYTAATGWEPSAVRASIMMSIVLAGWALKRPV
ncbi:MAG: ComEC/Rec2 family competence protein, partial [Verrucomicrobia bacterium]|nr:ComEC/Rec2 family competence protein [Verrucomicrobiota bacterium]